MYQNANEMLIVCRIKKIDMVDFKTNIIYMRIFLRMQWIIKNFSIVFKYDAHWFIQLDLDLSRLNR